MATRTQRRPVPQAKTSPNRNVLIAVGIGLIVVFAVLIVIVVSTPAAEPFTPLVTGRPNAEVSTTLINHGDVKMEETVESVFTIRNTGDRPLQIMGEPRVELVEGCCPPRAIVSTMTLQPGEESIIRLRFTMHEMMGGPHEFRVHVLTNDPTQTEIPLTILSNWIE